MCDKPAPQAHVVLPKGWTVTPTRELMDEVMALPDRECADRWRIETAKIDAIFPPLPSTKMVGINTDLLEALKYVRRFLNPEDHDVSYVDDVIDKAEGRGLYADTTEGHP